MGHYLDSNVMRLNALVPSSVENVATLRFCTIAATFVTLYDHLITFDLEVELIWKKRWSHSKFLFLCCRYLGDTVMIGDCVVFLHPHPSHEVCKTGIRVLGLTSTLTIWTTQIIMQHRIHALYGKSSKICICVSIAFAVEVVAMGLLIIMSLFTMDVTTSGLPDGAGACASVNLPKYSFLFWVPTLAFESLMFSLALRISYHHYQESAGTTTWRESSLVHVLLRDNLGHFFLAFASYATTCITWLTTDPRYYGIPSCFSYSITIIMGCRLVLNLCEAFYRPPGDQHCSAWTNNFVDPGEGGNCAIGDSIKFASPLEDLSWANGRRGYGCEGQEFEMEVIKAECRSCRAEKGKQEDEGERVRCLHETRWERKAPSKG